MAAKLKARLRVEGSAPTVIEESLIRSCIAELPPGTDEKARETMDLREVTCLSFSYKNIADIDNLVGFKNLVKLQLDNNRITEIKNLSHLVNLTWLDLSFNKIRKIEGLDTLTRLTDLSLYKNEITVVENLDTLEELRVLSVGHNLIKNLDKLVHYLRKFRKLRVLNLADNMAISQDPEYRTYVVAFLRQLKYLDYKLITEEEKQAARSQHENEVMVLEEEDRLAEQRAKEAAKIAARHAVLAEANIAGVEDFMDVSVAEDAALAKLQPLTFLFVPLEEAQARYRELVAEFISTMLERAQQKAEERRQYQQAVRAVAQNCEAQAREALRAFETKKKAVLREVATQDMSPEDEARVRGLLDALQQLQDRLMELEIQQVEQTEELTREFINVSKEINTLSAETINRFFGAEVRPLIQDTKAAMDALLEKELEKYAAATTEEALAAWTEEQQRLLDNKEGITSALATSNDTRNTKIDMLEDAITKRETETLDRYCTRLREDERERNRLRVSEIWGYVERQRNDIRSRFEELFSDEEEEGSERSADEAAAAPGDDD